MIKVKLKEIAVSQGLTNAYQLQKFTGFQPSMAARLWRGDWGKADLKTLNLLCNLLKCTPNDILEFTPDDDNEN